MDILQFEKKLEDIKLSKKDFAISTNLPYQTVMNWKRNNSVPVWVDSWLHNYVKAKDLDNIVETVKPYIKS